MRISIAAFTQTGIKLANRISSVLVEHEIAQVCDRRNCEHPLSDWTERAFSDDALVFVGAVGIAVRAIAPHIKDKLTDPAVICVDEQGRYVISLLSGHVGGANDLAREIAQGIGAQPVISTATDLNHVFAVDMWAKAYKLVLCERELAKEVSAALLHGKTVGFLSDFPLDGALPAGLQQTNGGALGIHVTLDETTAPFERTLHAVPRIVTVGAGCRRNVAQETFAQAVDAALTAHGVSPHAVVRLATIDRKADEPCLLSFCRARGIQMMTARAAELAALGGNFTPSAFVQETVGVDNVCERAAMWAGNGRLLFAKQAKKAVTVAAAIEDWSVRF